MQHALQYPISAEDSALIAFNLQAKEFEIRNNLLVRFL